jgi:hypothetical protein
MKISPCLIVALGVSAAFTSQPSTLYAQTPVPTGAPPPDAKPLVEAPKALPGPPVIEAPVNTTTISVAAGGQWAAGNSNMLAGTVNGAVDLRREANGFGAFLVGNYGQSATGGNGEVANAENLQGKLRYDRYLSDSVSLFALATGRHDRFQGLDFRLNLDPGIKYLFVRETAYALWGEAGYDFQYDIRRDDARVQLDAAGNPIAGAPLLDKTATDHSTRLFLGYRHSFNKEVTLQTGVEYLQSFLDSTRYRINFDALFAAKVGGGFSLGVGFGVRYDHAPLPGKKDTDTVSNLSLIYAFSDVPEKPTCPCPPPEPPPPAPGPPPPTDDQPSAPAPAPAAQVPLASPTSPAGGIARGPGLGQSSLGTIMP